MQIMEWIKIGSILVLMSFSKALAEPATPSDNLISNASQLVGLVEKIKTGNQGKDTVEFRWAALEDFQSNLWRAMALDPAPFVLVPLNQVPKNLFAAELNDALTKQWSQLKESSYPKDFRAQAEFDQYSNTVEQIINFRKARKFPPARAIAKRGTLDVQFEALTKKMALNADPVKGKTVGYFVSQAQTQQLEGLIQTVQAQAAMQSRDPVKKSVFADGGKFIWYALIALCCFTLGVAAYRFNPDMFQYFLDNSINSKPLQGDSKLDYVTWLKNFEDSLLRLKASQSLHERRIEEMLVNAEKIQQHAVSLHSDARIKNEANLEHRMANLIKEIHQQIDQAQKLQSADRVQIQSMLEQCLMLCDAVENQTILIDHGRLNEPHAAPKPLNQ